MGAPVVWFEIGTGGAEGLQRFYADLLGWKVKADNPMGYGEVDTDADGAGIPGGIWDPSGKLEVELDSYVAVFAAVPDLDAAVRRAEELGAKVVVPRLPVPDGPTVAYLHDPAGHTFGLLQPPA